MSGKKNSDVDDEGVQVNPGKLFIFYCLDFLWHHTYGNGCVVFLFKLPPMANVY